MFKDNVKPVLPVPQTFYFFREIQYQVIFFFFYMGTYWLSCFLFSASWLVFQDSTTISYDVETVERQEIKQPKSYTKIILQLILQHNLTNICYLCASYCFKYYTNIKSFNPRYNWILTLKILTEFQLSDMETSSLPVSDMIILQ